MVDLTVTTSKPVTAEAINDAMKVAAGGELKGILEFCDTPLVSSDFIGNPHSSIFDPALTRVSGEKLVKIVSWYDNEWGYSNRLAEVAEMVANKLPVSA
jgi:glyceraldehyde 3-phosphate dehydrogenase